MSTVDPTTIRLDTDSLTVRAILEVLRSWDIWTVLTSTGSANVQAITTKAPLSAYVSGMRRRVKAGATNTAALTLAENNLPPRAAVRNDGAATALAAGDWTAGVTYEIEFDGTNWIVLSACATTAGSFTTVDITGVAPATPVLDRIYRQSLIKAWCFCTVAGGAVTIVGGFNVSSVTYVAVGKFTLNFATALADTKYGWSGSNRDAANASWLREVAGGTRSTSALAIQNGTAAALDDPDDFSVIVFGN